MRILNSNALTRTPAILRARAFACAVAVTAAFGAAATPAAAQFGGRASFGEAFQPDILQRDMMLMTSSLQLEEWQRPIVEALLSDYMVSFSTGVEALKDKMKAASQEAARSTPADGDAILEKVMKPLDAWRVEKAQMKDKFLSDLRNQLGPQQLERWPSFERALRRERMLSAGDLSGESVDLWAVMGRMQLSSAEEEATRAAIAAYEVALDQALVAREARIKELEPALAEAMRAMNFDRGADLQDQVMTTRIAVRAANDGGIDSIAQALGARGAEFRQRALEAGYPDVYRTHPVMVLMQQARALDSLTEDQASRIDALMAEFRTACEAEDAKLYDAVRAEEPKAPRKRAQAAAERRAGGASSAPGTPLGQRERPRGQGAHGAREDGPAVPRPPDGDPLDRAADGASRRREGRHRDARQGEREAREGRAARRRGQGGRGAPAGEGPQGAPPRASRPPHRTARRGARGAAGKAGVS